MRDIAIFDRDQYVEHAAQAAFREQHAVRADIQAARKEKSSAIRGVIMFKISMTVQIIKSTVPGSHLICFVMITQDLLFWKFCYWRIV